MPLKILALVALSMLAAPAPRARAQAPDTVMLEELTWTEPRGQIRAGKTTVIVPIGGTEQNGPHMALGKHNVRVKALSERIAARARALPSRGRARAPRGRGGSRLTRVRPC